MSEKQKNDDHLLINFKIQVLKNNLLDRTISHSKAIF